MDAEFLKRTVGGPLSKAMTAMVIAQPDDPVEYLGRALLDHVRRVEEAEQKAAYAAKLQAVLEEHMKAQAEVAKVQEAAAAAAAARVRAETDAESALNASATHADAYGVALALLRERTGATGAYLGKRLLVNAGGSKELRYVAEAPAGIGMVGQRLAGGAAGDEVDEEGGEEGVTFRLWKRTEQPPPRPLQLDEDGNPIEDDSEPELIPPEHVYIENVVREPAAKFFGIPKLGGLLAVPVSYQTWLHPEGVGVVPPPSDEELEKERALLEIEAEEGEEPEAFAARKAAAVEAAAALAAARPVPGTYTKRAITGQLALCLHTMGQGRTFRAPDIELAKSWADKVARALERVEGALFEAEAPLMPKCACPDGEAQLAEALGAAGAAAGEAAIAALDPEASAAVKGNAEAAARYEIVRAALVSHREALAAISARTLPPPPEQSTVLRTALTLAAGAAAAAESASGVHVVVDPDIDAWRAEGARALRAGLVEAALAFSPADKDNVDTIGAAAAALEESDAATVATAGVGGSAFAALLAWVRAAAAYASAALAKRTEEEEAAAAAAEAAAAAAEAEAEAAAAAAEAAAAEAAEGAEGEGEEGNGAEE